MANILLISEDTLKSYSNLSENVYGKWILPAIREAQEMGLMPIIGECLYKRICEMVDNGDIDKKVYAAYKDLLDEKIQPYLLYQTLTNIVPLLNGKMGNIGTVATNDEHIVTLSQGELDLTQNYYRERADFYAKRLQEWVKANDLAFPELNCGCGNMKPNLERSNNSVGMWLGGTRGKKVRSNDCGCKTDAVRPDCPPCPDYDEGYQSGYTSGHTDGYGEGYDDGYDRGENDGFGEGFESGYTSGHTDGVEVVTTDFRHIDITQNGDYYKVGDYGAYSSITVDVATGSSCQLQQKNYSLTELGAGSWSVQPDAGYDGMSSLTIYDDDGYGESLYQRGQTDGYDSGYTSGYSSGYTSGYTSGSTNGYDRGYSSGWSSGYSSGYTSGYTDGASQQGGLESITFDVSQDTETIYPNSGYIGMSSVVVNAGDFGDGRYAEGYDDGVASMHVQDVKYDTPTYTEGEPYIVSPDFEYDSMASVELDLSGVHDDAYNEGEENTLSAVMDAAQELTATTNGVWTANTDTGLFSSVTVNVSGSSCNLESKSVEMSATTQTFEPSSGYDGMSAITVDAIGLCQRYYDRGLDDGESNFGTEITPESSITLNEYGTYYFVYDENTSIIDMTIHFRSTPSGSSGFKVRLYNIRNSYEDEPLYNLSASAESLDRIEIEGEEYGGTTYTGPAPAYIEYFFEDNIPEAFFSGVGIYADVIIIPITNTGSTITINSDAFTDSMFNALTFQKGVYELEEDAIHNTSIGLFAIWRSDVSVAESGITNNSNLGMIYLGDGVTFEADGTAFYGSSSLPDRRIGIVAPITPSDIRQEPWFINNLSNWRIVDYT